MPRSMGKFCNQGKSTTKENKPKLSCCLPTPRPHGPCGAAWALLSLVLCPPSRGGCCGFGRFAKRLELHWIWDIELLTEGVPAPKEREGRKKGEGRPEQQARSKEIAFSGRDGERSGGDLDGTQPGAETESAELPRHSALRWETPS